MTFPALVIAAAALLFVYATLFALTWCWVIRPRVRLPRVTVRR